MSEPTADRREVVETLASKGNPEGMIAMLLSTSQDTIIRDYAAELRRGRAQYRITRFDAVWQKLALDMRMKWLLAVVPTPPMGRDEEEVFLAKMKARVWAIGNEPLQEGAPDTRMDRIMSEFDDPTLAGLELGDLEDLIAAAADVSVDYQELKRLKSAAVSRVAGKAW